MPVEATLTDRDLLDAYRIDTAYDLYVVGECDDEEWFLIVEGD